MVRTRALYPLILIASFSLAAAVAPPAIAQPEKSPAELRADNDLLREKIEQLDSEVTELEKTLERKNRLIQNLREALRKARTAGSAGDGDSSGQNDDAPEETADPTAPIPAEPFASPDSMLLHLQSQFNQEFGEPDLSDKRAKQTYLRALRGWARDAQRDATGPVHWRVRVVAFASEGGNAADTTVEMLDKATGLPFGGVFAIRMTGRNGTRVRDGGVGAVWVLDGVLRSKIEIDDSSASAEGADDAMAIGPSAMYSFELALRTLQGAG